MLKNLDIKVEIREYQKMVLLVKPYESKAGENQRE